MTAAIVTKPCQIAFWYESRSASWDAAPHPGRDRDERKAPVRGSFPCRAAMQSRSILGVWVLLFFTDCAT
jgi:hypothetical protein